MTVGPAILDLLTDKIKNMCVQCKRYPHYRMILYISIITIVSGVLSISLFCSLPAVAALLTSICAGCITGIVFYILANVRNICAGKSDSG